jgi:hypothetical protein
MGLGMGAEPTAAVKLLGQAYTGLLERAERATYSDVARKSGISLGIAIPLPNAMGNDSEGSYGTHDVPAPGAKTSGVEFIGGMT